MGIIARLIIAAVHGIRDSQINNSSRYNAGIDLVAAAGKPKQKSRTKIDRSKRNAVRKKG